MGRITLLAPSIFLMENSVDYVTIHSNSPDRGFKKIAQLTKSSVSQD